MNVPPFCAQTAPLSISRQGIRRELGIVDIIGESVGGAFGGVSFYAVTKVEPLCRWAWRAWRAWRDRRQAEAARLRAELDQVRAENDRLMGQNSHLMEKNDLLRGEVNQLAGAVANRITGKRHAHSRPQGDQVEIDLTPWASP